MAERIPVPDDWEAQSVLVCGRQDHHWDVADVQLPDRDHARSLQVRRDDEGRYVGCSEDLADAVREALGVGDETATCEVVKADGEVCGRELPCPYHSDDSGGGDE